MTQLNNLGKDIKRLSQIIKIISKYGFAPSLNSIAWVKKIPSYKTKPILKTSPAIRFSEMLQELGPIFIKLGQLLSTRNDLLPADFIKELRKLRDKVPAFSFDTAKKQLQNALAANIDDIFVDFTKEPQASASISQVHQAILKDGTKVAVKIRRPKITTQIKTDFSVLLLLAHVLEFIIAEASSYKAVDLANEFKTALLNETNFNKEANNIELFYTANKDRNITIPKVYKQLSCDSVLVMDFIDGEAITNLSNSNTLLAEEKAKQLIDLGFKQIFEDGIFHGDPHPGNIFITKDKKIALIDFGLIGHITQDTQDKLLAILLAINLKDADTLSRMLINLGETSKRVEISQFQKAIRIMLHNYADKEISHISLGQVLADILDISLKYEIRLGKEFALLCRACISLEGIIRILHPKLNLSSELAKKAEVILANRLDIRKFKKEGMRHALSLATFFQSLPSQISQSLFDLEHGQLQIKTSVSQLNSFDRLIKGLALSICSAMLSSSLVLGGILTIIFASQKNQSIPSAAIVCFLLAFIPLSYCFIWSSIGTKLPKLSLRQLRYFFKKNN